MEIIEEDLEPKFYQLKINRQQEDFKQSCVDLNQQEAPQQDKKEKQKQIVENVFNYSTKNAEMVQTILLSPNYRSPQCSRNGMQFVEQIDKDLTKVAYPQFKSTSFQKVNQLSSNQNENCFENKQYNLSIERLSVQQTSQMASNKQNYTGKRQGKNQRTSIFLQNQTTYYQQSHSKERGCVPLKNKDKTQTLLIQTYRKIWSRFQSLQAKRVKQQKQKQLKQLKQKEIQTLLHNKDQNKKKKLITYDYNGQPILLKHIIKQAVRPDNQVFISPQKQNIITCPLNKLKKRKAQIFQSNQNFQTDQVVFEQQQQTQFLKIPFKLKKGQNREMNQEVGKSKKIKFSEFKRRLQLEKKLLQQQQQMKKQKNTENKNHRLSEFIDRNQSVKSLLVRKKKCNSQQKIITNYKIFEDIFKIKARKVSTIHNKQNKTNLKVKTIHEFNEFKNLDDQLKYIQNFRPSSRFNRNSYSNFQVHQIDKQILLNNNLQQLNRNSAGCTSDYEDKGNFFMKSQHLQTKKNGKMQSVEMKNITGKTKFKTKVTQKTKD